MRADLQLDLDGASATLTGDGDRLVLATGQPGSLLDSLAGASFPVGAGRADGQSANGRTAVGRVAEALRDAGITLDVRGPRGTVASLGSGVDSAWGRVLAGSRALRPGAPAAVGPLLFQAVRRRPAARAAGIAVATIVGIVVASRARRR